MFGMVGLSESATSIIHVDSVAAPFLKEVICFAERRLRILSPELSA